ncbi:hypothetical protein AB9E26_35600, partial [Rhizobium leguminosarum]
MRVNTYLINLDRAPLRRFRIERLLASFGLAFERVAAVDGAGLSLPHPGFDEASYLRQHGRRPNPVESMRQVSADIAHDLKTPLKRLRLTLDA